MERQSENIHMMTPLKYRTLWISDLHLGSRGCNADYLLDFLRNTQCDYLYLVGDIIDLWAMKRGFYWPQSHNDVIRTILGKAKHGTKVIYIPGNHDEPIRDHVGTEFGNIEIKRRDIFTTATGKRLLILHGDEFDSIVCYSRFVAHVGDVAYELLLKFNRYFNYVRRKLGYPYWSISAYIKHKVKNAVAVISNYEEAVVNEARKAKVDGVVCGHIHHPEIKIMDGVLYCNDGDWVESCTALTENFDGKLEVIHWSDQCNTLHTHNEESAIASNA